jgi:hypothetical protein
MAGLIASFGPRRPDADSGRLLRRLMCPLADVPAVLGWGEIMEAQAGLASRTAQMLWRIPAGAPQPRGMRTNPVIVSLTVSWLRLSSRGSPTVPELAGIP